MNQTSRKSQGLRACIFLGLLLSVGAGAKDGVTEEPSATPFEVDEIRDDQPIPERQPSESAQRGPESAYYIYRGEPVDLPLDGKMIAIRYRKGSTADDRTRALASAGLAGALQRPTGVEGWHLVDLDEPLAGLSDADTRMTGLLGATEIEFASPVFRGRLEDSWVVMTPDILVRFRPEHAATADALLPVIAPGTDVVERDFANLPGTYKLRSRALDGLTVLAQANALALDPRVVWAEPDMQVSGRTDLQPDDTWFVDQWALQNTGQFGGVADVDIDADSAWEITTGSASVKVLVLDSGAQLTHPDLAIASAMDFTTDAGAGGPVNVCDSHGTPVAGIIGATMNNAVGVAGIAPDVEVLSARIYISNVASPCSGFFTAQPSWIAQGLEWGGTQGAQISNSSFSLAVQSNIIDDAYDNTYDNGMVHFASAGNEGVNGVTYPSSHPAVNACSNIAQNGQINPSSNFGPELSFSAPGTLLRTTDRTGADGFGGGDYMFFTGTSAAAPTVAAVAALLLSVEPTLTPAEVEAKLQCSARDLGSPGKDDIYGWGLINAFNAILMPLGVDSDSDGTDDACDNCPDDSNAGQADGDADGIGDACDTCPNDVLNDLDGDLWCADVDNCPETANPAQTDTDMDGVGDACACAAETFVFTGEAVGDWFGWKLRGAGDVDRDGYGDVIVGARRNDQVFNNSGKAYIYSGFDGSLLFEFVGETANDEFGVSASGAGDVNGDGYHDVIVGAYLNDASGSNAGRAYVFYGGPGPFPVLRTAALADLIINGSAAGDNLGWEVAGIGDWDGDGAPDLLAGAIGNSNGGPGKAAVYSGADGSLIDEFVGEAPGDLFGYSIADAGDVNGDGVTDLVVGAQRNDAGGSNAGRAYVYSGADASQLHVFTGEQAGDSFGAAVAGAGDPNQDGRADLIVGAPRYDGGGRPDSNTGRAYVLSGLDGSQLDVFTGSQSSAELGWAVSAAADLDGDGGTDLLVAAPTDGVPGRRLAGRVYAFSGQSGALLDVFGGESDLDQFGRWIGGGRDLNQDGVAEIVVGAYTNDNAGTSAGRAYVYTLPRLDADHDGFCPAADNCPLVYNPGQSNDDLDLFGNVCDACPGIANGIDDDQDGLGAGCDCQEGDPNDRRPDAVELLTVDLSPTGSSLLDWTAAAGADAYSVTRGDLSALDFTGLGSCLEEGVDGLSVEDPAIPGSGEGFAYLVQGQSFECGLGVLGYASSEEARSNSDAGACVGAIHQDAHAASETAVLGTVTNSFTETTATDDAIEVVEEELSGGNPANQFSQLEHQWTIDVAPGSRIEFHVEGFRTSSADGDDFIFEYWDGGSWVAVAMSSLPFADADTDLIGLLPSTISGPLLVRVVDTNRDPGNQDLDTVSIDELFVRSIP